ncbi:MAG: hypothetical protein CRN43_13530 [Candidatus Nephrothrix sp. EaCA]|nr:MAG: hypothetical protein CRN43_13530 [Candidatus Nephrothrix sp. EaCA]
MRHLKTLLTFSFLITTIINAFSQEAPISAFSQEEGPRRNFLFGIGYAGVVSLDKGTVNYSFSSYCLRFFKKQNYYAIVDFWGNDFFQQERRGASYTRVSKIGVMGGIKCTGSQRVNLYADVGGGFGYNAPEDYENKHMQAGLRSFFLTAHGAARADIHLLYARYFFNARSDNQISLGVGIWF